MRLIARKSSIDIGGDKVLIVSVEGFVQWWLYAWCNCSPHLGGEQAVGAVALGLVVTRRHHVCGGHANLNIRTTTQNWPFSVLGSWDKNTRVCAGAMSYRRDSPATTRI